ncbi:uncharacterized protein [Nicotiana tomentosiformis]|uniref:uncharacterized protein n=1 Tax=Nicotiana tomentosiformis TaxID=4098 RepID=UPI00388C8963
MAINEKDSDSPFAASMSTPTTKLIDHNHPLYIHHSDTQGSVLTSIQLQGLENYSIWSRSMKIVLHVSLSLISFVIYAFDAHTVWEDLKERFDKDNASRACYFHKTIATLTQGISSVSVYYTKLRELWDEYETITPPPSCGCAESRKHVEHYQIHKLYQFLTGLNESYENAKNQGHTRENYFKLHRYPSNFKNKRRGGAPHAQANSSVNSGILEPQGQGHQDKEVESAANAIAAGPTCTVHAFMTNLVHNNWIVDTGATNHMVHCLNLLETYDEIPKKARSKVHLPTGEHVSITHIGTLKWEGIGYCKEELGLYILKADGRQVFNQQASFQLVSLSTSTVNTISYDINKDSNLADNKSCTVFSLWYQRLGHAPLKILRSVKVLHDIHFRQHHCTVCPIAKQSRLPFPVSSSYSKSAFDMVHGDVWGPYRVSTHDGKGIS